MVVSLLSSQFVSKYDHVYVQDGWTPLNDAASQGRTEIVKMLLEKGADVNASNNVVSPKY